MNLDPIYAYFDVSEEDGMRVILSGLAADRAGVWVHRIVEIICPALVGPTFLVGQSEKGRSGALP